MIEFLGWVNKYILKFITKRFHIVSRAAKSAFVKAEEISDYMAFSTYSRIGSGTSVGTEHAGSRKERMAEVILINRNSTPSVLDRRSSVRYGPRIPTSIGLDTVRQREVEVRGSVESSTPGEERKREIHAHASFTFSFR